MCDITGFGVGALGLFKKAIELLVSAAAWRFQPTIAARRVPFDGKTSMRDHCRAADYVSSNSNGSPKAGTQGSLTHRGLQANCYLDRRQGRGHTHMAPSAQTNTDPVFAAATPNNSTDEELQQALLSVPTLPRMRPLSQPNSASDVPDPSRGIQPPLLIIMGHVQLILREASRGPCMHAQHQGH